MNTTPYTIKSGDTLSGIAQQNDTTVTQLKTLNQINNPNQIRVGQIIQVPSKATRQSKPGVQYVFIDKLLQPIEGLLYQFKLPSGKIAGGATDKNGLTQLLDGLQPGSAVEMWVQRQIGSFKKIHDTTVEETRKIVTAYSPSVKATVNTQKHNGSPGPGTTTGRDKDGHPIIVIDKKDIDLDFLDKYTGETITESDYEDAGKNLGVEKEILQAIARQETGRSPFFEIGGDHLPTIVYERHVFRRQTSTGKGKNKKSPYEATNPNICGPQYKRQKKDKQGKPTYDIDETYGASGIFQYKRLLIAYQLNQTKALESCSWGKFQMMGFNYKGAGYSDVKSFTRDISINEKNQLKALINFCKNNSSLLSAMKTKDWEGIAAGYNGAGWQATNPEYASNIGKYYNGFKGAKK